MGYGNYSHEAHQALVAGRSRLPREQLFVQRSCHPLMNPKGVKVRESRDSADHPESLGIAFALDVTGSMGDIPDLLARHELPKFMRMLADCQVPDPQLLFLAVGDATSDQAPLQVGQFESKAELMDQGLTWSYLEGGGGGQNTESYELALYFLAEHTDMDCWVKRKKRAYLFMTGDELPYPAVSRHQVEALMGEKLDEDISTEAVIATVAETYEPFFLIPDRERRTRCEKRWRELLGDHVVCLDRPVDTCAASAAIVALAERRVGSMEALGDILAGIGLERDRVGAVIRAIQPFAATLGHDASRDLGPPTLPAGRGRSLWRRLLK
jgi:predicted protein tyrosine phosphatase